VPRIEVTLRVRRDSIRRLEDLVDFPVLEAAVEEPDPDPDTWRRLRITFDWPREVTGRLLSLGGSVEVLAPAELRAEIAELAAETVARYREPAMAGLVTG
jgi:predicted DNA-binding transcriptional regulator YafY